MEPNTEFDEWMDRVHEFQIKRLNDEIASTLQSSLTYLGDGVITDGKNEYHLSDFSPIETSVPNYTGIPSITYYAGSPATMEEKVNLHAKRGKIKLQFSL